MLQIYGACNTTGKCEKLPQNFDMRAWKEEKRRKTGLGEYKFDVKGWENVDRIHLAQGIVPGCF
jgi:hypothetical protein